ncbi:AMP-ligase [Lysobacter sp. TY2-98]|uniref:AMP-binding protein n=1 Tax=Lysobacter sp. TY2-98 TaxID=2290922 RepID=UPI000E20947E|nr:AMP-binding protein [Lysobacter sp. TY2-98]AXK73088.1 AMP-ligase [Lysobacter sp. TY2-98]
MSAVIGTEREQACRLQALVTGAPSRVVAFDAGRPVTRALFERHVRAVAAALPSAGYAVNLCEDRYRFIVALCAAALRGQVTLLPPSRAPAVVDTVRADHPDSICIGDIPLDPAPPGFWRLPDELAELDGAPLEIDADATLLIGFTSGSTGQPKPNLKTLASFVTSTMQNLAAMDDLFARDDVTPLVATVPPQHMYGMETSVMLPLLGDVAVHGGRPFFPQDVARAVADCPRPPVLVTTPVHLRALVQAHGDDPSFAMPPIAAIVSATAPLPQDLAQAAEAAFGCEVREMFGSTETCILARRRTAHDDAWTTLPGVTLAPQPDGTLVDAPHLATPVALADLVELLPDGRFRLRGRNADLLEIAGKRASLGDLTRKLLSVPGVLDGVVVQLDADAHGVCRIAALAVAPTLKSDDILRALRQQMDPVFLPRRLRCIASLPRNETGKLPRATVLALLHS